MPPFAPLTTPSEPSLPLITPSEPSLPLITPSEPFAPLRVDWLRQRSTGSDRAVPRSAAGSVGFAPESQTFASYCKVVF